MDLPENAKDLEMLAEIGNTESEAIKKLREWMPDRPGVYEIKTMPLADERYLATCQYERQPAEKVARGGTGSHVSPLARS